MPTKQNESESYWQYSKRHNVKLNIIYKMPYQQHYLTF
jgi:hypothetical protein